MIKPGDVYYDKQHRMYFIVLGRDESRSDLYWVVPSAYAREVTVRLQVPDSVINDWEKVNKIKAEIVKMQCGL